MTVYIVLNEDRHYDTQVEVFAHIHNAIRRAEEIAEVGARGHPVTPQSMSINIPFYIDYSGDGSGTVEVIEATVKESNE